MRVQGMKRNSSSRRTTNLCIAITKDKIAQNSEKTFVPAPSENTNNTRSDKCSRNRARSASWKRKTRSSTKSLRACASANPYTRENSSIREAAMEFGGISPPSSFSVEGASRPSTSFCSKFNSDTIPWKCGASSRRGVVFPGVRVPCCDLTPNSSNFSRVIESVFREFSAASGEDFLGEMRPAGIDYVFCNCWNEDQEVAARPSPQKRIIYFSDDSCMYVPTGRDDRDFLRRVLQ